MKHFRIALLAMIVMGAVFGSGCNDLHQTFHEKTGVMIQAVQPAFLFVEKKTAASGTQEATFNYPLVSVSFQNLNNIPAVIKSYRVDYTDTADGSTKSNLTFAAQTVLPISSHSTPVASGTSSTGTTGTTATTSTATSTTTGSSSSSTPNSISLYLWTNKVLDAMYGDRSNTLDDRQLLATMTFYGEDYNGNTFELQASVTLTP